MDHGSDVFLCRQYLVKFVGATIKLKWYANYHSMFKKIEATGFLLESILYSQWYYSQYVLFI